MTSPQQKAIETALRWYIDHGVDEVIGNEALDHRKPTPKDSSSIVADLKAETANPQKNKALNPAPAKGAAPQIGALGKNDARAEAITLAKEAHSRDALMEAIQGFDGLAVKRTATNMVFSDGHPDASVMVVGEAPGADEDRQGKPFVGVSGQLLDRILKAIALERTSEAPEEMVYISNILNWRPPGNRTPNQSEMAVSLPFIEKHIALIQPKILILCGSVAAKTLLGRNDSISRMRGKWHDYKPLTKELGLKIDAIPTIATYHPAYLLRTPGQKKAVWSDMLDVMHKLKELNIK